MWASACSTEPVNTCGHSSIFSLAFSIQASAASKTLSPLRADIVTTLHLSSFSNLSTSILSPFFSTISIMLIATTVGMPTSRS